jgi:hypothetical protein
MKKEKIKKFMFEEFSAGLEASSGALWPLTEGH